MGLKLKPQNFTQPSPAGTVTISSLPLSSNSSNVLIGDGTNSVWQQSPYTINPNSGGLTATGPITITSPLNQNNWTLGGVVWGAPAEYVDAFYDGIIKHLREEYKKECYEGKIRSTCDPSAFNPDIKSALNTLLINEEFRVESIVSTFELKTRDIVDNDVTVEMFHVLQWKIKDAGLLELVKGT